MKSDELQNQITALENRIHANELVTKELANRIDAAISIIAKLTELEKQRKYFYPRWTASQEHELVDSEYKQIISSYNKFHYPKPKKKAK